MQIPSSFKIGGQEYNVEIVDNLDDDIYGYYSYTPSVIKIARHSAGVEVPDNQKEATFWHELFHAFQYMFDCTTDEAQAQCFSNFMMEFLESKK